ncbi:MAG: DUF1799 domain-containing protein [Burkholderiaceae bacterium]
MGGASDSRTEEAAAAAIGLAIEHASARGECLVWPQNETAVNVFHALLTQWAVGPVGAVGLRYEAIPVVLRLMGVARSVWADTFAALRVMEAEALSFFAERRG